MELPKLEWEKRGDPRPEPEPADAPGCEQCDVCDLLGRRLPIAIRVADEKLVLLQYQHLHDGERAKPGAHSDDIAHGRDMAGSPPDDFAKRRIGGPRFEQGRPPALFFLR